MEIVINGETAGFLEPQTAENEDNLSQLLHSALALKEGEVIQGTFLMMKTLERSKDDLCIKLELMSEALVTQQEDIKYKAKYDLTLNDIEVINEVINDVKFGSSSSRSIQDVNIPDEAVLEARKSKKEAAQDFYTTMWLLFSFGSVLLFAYGVKYVLFVPNL